MGEQHALTEASMPPQMGRDMLISAITKFLANQDAATLDRIRLALEHEVDQFGPDALTLLGERIAATGADWDYYPRDPLARRIHRVLADQILEDSALSGVEHAHTLAGKPTVIFANHLSYSDANLLEVLLYRAGAIATADSLTVIAGPKVYSSLKRRFSSLCFATIKTPQSSTVSTDGAVMNQREVARAARRCIDIAHERLKLGDTLLVFAEGTRSRTNGLQQTLTAVSRYLDGPEPWILPAGVTGSEAMFPIGEEALYAVTVKIRLGAPIEARALRERAGGDRRLMMDAVGLAIAAALPPDYQGAYGDDVAGLEDARLVLSDLAR